MTSYDDTCDEIKNIKTNNNFEFCHNQQLLNCFKALPLKF